MKLKLRFYLGLWISLVGIFVSLASTAQITASVTEGCAPLTSVQFSHSFTNATNFSWTFGNGGSSTLSAPVASFVNPGVYTVSLSALMNGVVVDDTMVITVFENPTADFSVMPTTLCLGTDVQLTDGSEGGAGTSIVDYEWDYGNGTTGSFGPNPSFAYANTGIYPITLIVTDENGCSDSQTMPDAIAVSQSPDLDILSDPNPIIACEPPLTVTFNNETTSNSPTSNSLDFTWDFGNGETAEDEDSPSVTYTEEGLYEISVMVVDDIGCTSSQTIPVSIQQPEAEISVEAENGFVCTDVEVIVDGTQGGTFNYGDGVITGSPFHSYSGEGEYTITYTVTAAGCSVQSSTTVNVEVPIGEIVSVPEFSCENPAEFTYFLESDSDIDTYQWTIPSMTLSDDDAEPTFTINVDEASEFGINGNTSFSVFLDFTSASGCPGSALFDGNTISLPTAIMYPDVTQGCAPLLVNFVNESHYSYMENVVSFEWHFGDGNVETVADSSSVSHVYNSAGEFDAFVILETIEGCLDTSFFHMIEVGTDLNPSFEVSNNPICPNQPVSIINTTANDNLADGYSYSGDLNDFSSCFNDPSPTISFSNSAGEIEITQSVSYNGCISTSTQTITVDGPVAKIGYGCNCDTPFDYTFNAEATDAQFWTWSFGDGTQIQNSTATSVSHTYESTGDFMAVITAYNPGSSCGPFSDSVLVKVRDLSAELDIVDKVCVNEAIMAIAVNTQDVAGSNDQCYRNYLWDFGDNTLPIKTMVDSAGHTFSSGGEFTVTLSVKDDNECVISTSQEITVFEINPEIEFLADGACVPMTVDFADVSPSDTTIVSWEWDFGLDNFSSDSSTTFTFGSDFEPPYVAQLILVDEMGCTDSTEVSISPDLPDASFSASNLQLCAGDTLSLSAENQVYHSYEWITGTEISIDSSIVDIAYPDGGIYTISLVVENEAGCLDTLEIEDYVSVQDFPDVGFSTNVDDLENLCYPILIEFTDTSDVNIFSYREWDLGNGFPVAPNPTVGTIYQEPGIYTVNLEVGTTFGCVSSLEEEITIEGPVAAFELSTDEICLYDSVTMQISDSIDVAYFSWEFGNGQDSAMTNPLTYHYDIVPQSGSTNIQLITWSADSACSAAAELPFQVNLTLAGFDRNNETALEDTVHCFGIEDQLTNTSFGATDYVWDLGNGVVSTNENVNFTYQSDGTYNVMLAAGNSNTGCLDTLIKPIHVFPQMNVSADDGLTCEGDTLFLSANGGETYLWNPGEALNDSLSQFPYLTTQENTELTVFITDTNNCTKSVELITEYIRPALTPAWSDTVINFGTTVDFNYALQPYHSHHWFGESLNECSTCSFGFLTPDGDAVYGLTVTDELSCFTDTFYFEFTVLDELLFWMPNAFSPNADGVNDLFFPEITRARTNGYQFMIFNRNGQLIWETNDINDKWNGALQGSSYYTESQLFLWKVRLLDLKSSVHNYNGSVMLLR